jgi:hypothetical protein
MAKWIAADDLPGVDDVGQWRAVLHEALAQAIADYGAR